MPDIDPMALTNEARKEARVRQAELTRNLRDEIATQPAVSEGKYSRDDERQGYLGTRNNQYEIDALVQQYRLKRTIGFLKEQEQKLQRDMKGGRYDAT